MVLVTVQAPIFLSSDVCIGPGDDEQNLGGHEILPTTVNIVAYAEQS